MTLEGRVVITGGSGSLGGAILDRAQRESWPASFIVYSRDEVKQAALAERFPAVRFILGDVQDREGLLRAMRGADLVIHAAAYKRVPEAERETIACAQANVMGSVNVATAALQLGIPRVVAISTDKACAPINAYGQSKALMERIWQSCALERIGPRFHLVRYGNVLASRGSVIPALMAQVERGDPITLTDPGMTRFWLTLDDAVSLVIQALELEPGEILIPACPASTMQGMADAIAPGHPTRIIGTRGGEKRHESLLNAEESPYARAVRGGWALRSLALPAVDQLSSGFTYTSAQAKQITAGQLGAVIQDLKAHRPARLLA